MARSRYTGLEDALPRIRELDVPDLGFSGGLGLDSYARSRSPIARAVSQRAAAPTTPPSGAENILRGSPLAGLGTQPAAATVPADTPPPPPDSPLPLQGLNPYDPSKLNYEGSVYSGPSVYSTQPFKPKYSQLTAADQESLRRIVEDVLDKQYGYKLGDWRAKLEQDPQGFWARLESYLGPSGLLSSITKKYSNVSVNPSAASQYIDQAAYNQGLTRLRQTTLAGAREDEDSLIAELASRGLLNSGIAAREIGRLRSERAANFRNSASRLNEIMFSNASSQAKQEALLRLNAELQLANETALSKLRAKLEQDLIQSQHENDFLGFLGQVGGTGLGLALSPERLFAQPGEK